MTQLCTALALAVVAATIYLPPAVGGDSGAARIGGALLLAGFALAISARRCAETHDWPRTALAMLMPLLLAAVALPPVGRWAAIAAAVGLCLRVTAGARRGRTAVGEALLGIGGTTALCAAITPLYLSLWARAVGWPPLASLVQTAAALAGWDARAWETTLAFADGDTVYRHALAPEGLLPLPLLCLGLLGVLLADRRRFFIGTLALFCIARYLMLARLTIEGFAPNLFWSREVLALSTLLAAPLLAWSTLPLEARRPSAQRREKDDRLRQPPCETAGLPLHLGQTAQRPAPRRGRPPALWPARLAALGVATAAAAALSVWAAAGVPKQGRLLIDESTSNWSQSLRPFDTSWFGMEATYNYASFAEYLNHFFHVTINERAPLSQELLADCDVLLLKMPTRPLTLQERQAVDAFVRRGGGLWLIGDHTNVFGTTTHLNALVAPMGLRFRHDATWDLTTGGPALWESGGAFAAHPVMRRVSRFEFQTGCSLAASLATDDLMVAPRVVSRPADYGTPNFFPQARPNNYGGVFGPAILAAAAHYGRGRVVAFTDSTAFSTFSMFARGRPELAVNTVAWLNRRNRPLWPARVATLLALVAALWVVAGAWRQANERWLASALVLTTLGGGWLAARGFGQAATPTAEPRPETPLRRVYFLAERSDALFENLDPLHWNVRDDPERERRFTTFLVGTQRFGLAPTIVSEVPSPANDPSADLMVMVRPRGPLSPIGAKRLRRFVTAGGRLLVLPDPSDPGGAAALDAILAPLGVRCVGQVSGECRVIVPAIPAQVALHNPYEFAGGEVLAHDGEGRPLIVRAACGRGEVIVVGDGQLFANARLGDHFDMPEGEPRNALALQFWLFGDLLLADRQVVRRFPAVLAAGSVRCASGSG